MACIVYCGMKRDDSQTISFRLDADDHRRLLKAAESVDASPGKYARKLVLDALNDAAALANEAAFDEIQDGLRTLREDIATALTAVLINAAKVKREDAERWVREALLR